MRPHFYEMSAGDFANLDYLGLTLRVTAKLPALFSLAFTVCSFFPRPFGGDEEDRTPDPLRARQVLSQLSYTPKC